jgi:hypothetical protein
MYTRESDARDVATAIMDEGAAQGDAVQECNLKQSILSYLDQYGSASTVGGWIDTVRENTNRPSLHAMLFVFMHKYIRDWFPDDVVHDMVELVLDGDRDLSQVISFIASEYDALPIELQAKLPILTPARMELLNSPESDIPLLVGDF